MTQLQQPGRAAIERCDLSDLPVTSCGCRKHRPDGGQIHIEPAAVRASHSYGPKVIAKYPGKCACGDRYEVGEAIRVEKFANGQGTGRWLHSECAEEPS